jgi:hypothetical protein
MINNNELFGLSISEFEARFPEGIKSRDDFDSRVYCMNMQLRNQWTRNKAAKYINSELEKGVALDLISEEMARFQHLEMNNIFVKIDDEFGERLISVEAA